MMTDAQYYVLACWANSLLDRARYADMPSVAFSRWNCQQKCEHTALCRRFQAKQGGRAVTVAIRAIREARHG